MSGRYEDRARALGELRLVVAAKAGGIQYLAPALPPEMLAADVAAAEQAIGVAFAKFWEESKLERPTS